MILYFRHHWRQIAFKYQLSKRSRSSFIHLFNCNLMIVSSIIIFLCLFCFYKANLQKQLFIERLDGTSFQ